MINNLHLYNSLFINLTFFHFSRAVLQVQDSNGINDIGTPTLKLTVCVFIVYCMLYFSLFKGVKSSGKFLAVFINNFLL